GRVRSGGRGRAPPRLAVRELMVVMQVPDLSLDGSVSLEPTTPPVLVAYEVDEKTLVEFALRNRADLLQFEYQEIQRNIDVMMRDNETLPEVDLVAAWTFNGFDFAGRSLSEATSNLGDGNPAGWAIGFTASVPIGNEIRLAAYQAAMLRRLQAVATLRDRQVTVTGEVLDALDSLDLQWDRILTSRFQEEAAKRFFEAYKTLFDRGQIASANLTQALQSLNNAGINRARAESDYQIVLARLAQAAGGRRGPAGGEWSHPLDARRLEAPGASPAAPLPDRFLFPITDEAAPSPTAPSADEPATVEAAETQPAADGPTTP
ncbi:MAG: TolC family protein, partial [Phycisphaerales bacterium]